MPATKRPPRPIAWECNLKAIREKRGLTAKALAKLAYVSYAGIRQLEDGGDPRLTTAHRIASVLGLKISQIWTYRAKESLTVK